MPLRRLLPALLLSMPLALAAQGEAVLGEAGAGPAVLFDGEEITQEELAALTPEQIVAGMRRHINPEKIIIVRAGDFAKAAASSPGTTAPTSQQ